MIRVGIAGGTGYTSGELLRLLQYHPNVSIEYIYSSSQAGMQVSSYHHDLLSMGDCRFSDYISSDVDIIFLCTGHGISRGIMEKHPIDHDVKIIDLSRDFRLEGESSFGSRSFVYGLPEYQREQIAQASNVANPGCFATAIELALLPLADAQQLKGEVHINATTGSTGAGAATKETTHFSWRNGNVSWYKPFVHQHIDEIRQTLTSKQGCPLGELLFIPQRGNYTRGILAMMYTHFEDSIEDAYELYHSYYSGHPFVHISSEPISLKPVVNTNNCHLHLHKYKDRLLITSAIDNLLKGASGQAVQNMNLMFGRDEKSGLQLKSTFF